MAGKIVPVTILTLLLIVLAFSQVAAEIFKWVDDQGTIHFTEEESAIPEKYREKAGKKVLPKDPALPPKEKVKAPRQERKGSIRQTTTHPKEKQQVNIRKIESDVTDALGNIILFWKNKKYDAIYENGDRQSRSSLARENFRKQMERTKWELASSWETVRDIQVEVGNATLAYATARIGYKSKPGGDTRFRTETYEMRLENGAWRINLLKILSSRK